MLSLLYRISSLEEVSEQAYRRVSKVKTLKIEYYVSISLS